MVVLEDTCRYLGNEATVGRLAVDMTCAVADATTANIITDHMLLLGCVQSVSFNLSGANKNPSASVPIHNGRNILQETGRRLIQHHANEPFPFARLPKELQLEILKHTSIVINGTLALSGARSNPLKATPEQISRTQRSRCQCGCCGTPESRDGSPENGCRCRQYLRWSSECACDVWNSAVFGVSRAMRAVAMDVFYIHDRFLLKGPRDHITHKISGCNFQLRQLRYLTVKIEEPLNMQWAGERYSWECESILKSVLEYAQANVLRLDLVIPSRDLSLRKSIESQMRQQMWTKKFKSFGVLAVRQ